MILMTLSSLFSHALYWSGIHTLAFLYTDPGSGALLWQLLIASFFGALFYARSFIRRVKATISRRQNEQQAPAAATTTNEGRLSSGGSED
jgi:hypothetical protein